MAVEEGIHLEFRFVTVLLIDECRDIITGRLLMDVME